MTENIESLSAKLAELEKTSSYKTEVISISAHELRTSLTALKWILNMMIDGDSGVLNDHQTKLIEKSLERVERMIKLSAEMLLINHDASTDLSYEWQQVDPLKILKGVLFDFQGEFHKHDIETVFLEPKKSIPHLKSDPDKMRVVLQNLLENSIKYTPKSGRVIVSIDTKNDAVEMAVEDSGIGIPTEDKDQLFQKFYRGARAKKSHAIGSGLGLYTAKKIMEAHGGRIWYESNPEKGVTFHVAFPTS